MRLLLQTFRRGCSSGWISFATSERAFKQTPFLPYTQFVLGSSWNWMFSSYRWTASAYSFSGSATCVVLHVFESRAHCAAVCRFSDEGITAWCRLCAEMSGLTWACNFLSFHFTSAMFSPHIYSHSPRLHVASLSSNHYLSRTSSSSHLALHSVISLLSPQHIVSYFSFSPFFCLGSSSSFLWSLMDIHPLHLPFTQLFFLHCFVWARYVRESCQRTCLCARDGVAHSVAIFRWVSPSAHRHPCA